MNPTTPIATFQDMPGFLDSSSAADWFTGDASQWTSCPTTHGSLLTEAGLGWAGEGLPAMSDPFLESLDTPSTAWAHPTCGPVVEEPGPAPSPRQLLVFASLGEDRPGVLVCALCGQGLPGESTWESTWRHWRARSHKSDTGTPPVEEKRIAREVWERYSGRAIQNERDWERPAAIIATIEHLRVFNAYQCPVEDCSSGYVRQSHAGNRPDTHRWRVHLREEHGQKEFETPGRPFAASALASREDNGHRAGGGAWGPVVKVQRVLPKTPFFRVREAGDAVDEQASGSSDGAAMNEGDVFLEQFLQCARQARERDEDSRRFVAGPAAQEVDPWARANGFATRLQGFEYVAARRTCDRPPADDDERISIAAAVWNTAGSALRKSHATAKRAGDFVQTAVARVQAGRHPLKPWKPYATDSTIADHVRTVQSCLTFFVRTQTCSTDAAAAPRYRVNAAVREAWIELEHELCARDGQGDEGKDENGDNDDSGHHLEAAGRREAGPRLTRAEQLTLALLVCLLQQRATVNEAEELPLVVALTVLAIRPSTGNFLRPGDYTHILAGFDKMARCAVLTHTLCRGAVDSDEFVAAVEDCLVRGPNHTMTWLGGTKALARRIACDSAPAGRLTWIAGDEAYLYGDHRLSLEQLRAVIHEALAQQIRILCEQLLFVDSVDELPPVPWSRLVDRLDDTAKGSCWTDPANQEALQHGENWLRDHIRRTRPGRFTGRNGQALQERALLEFGEGMRRFAEEGMPLAVWGVGMPIRGTTVTSYRWRNSNDGSEKRNLVVQDGQLTLVGGHIKTHWAGAVAPMHVLPREVAEVWGWFVWLVKPFWEAVRGSAGQVEEDASFLFPAPRSLNASAWVSGALKKSSSRIVPGGLGLRIGRQLVVGFARRFTPADILAGGTSAQLDARRGPESRQAVLARAGADTRAGGSARSRNLHHNGGDNDDEEDEDDEDDEDDNDNNGGNWDGDGSGRWQHRLPGQMSKEDVGADASYDAFQEVRDLFKSRSAVELQTGHSTRVGYANYGGDAHAIPNLDELQLRLWSTVSRHWHVVLNFPSALAARRDVRGVKRQSSNDAGRRLCSAVKTVENESDVEQNTNWLASTASPPPPSVKRPRLERGQSVSKSQALRLLRDLLQKPHAKFRGKQWEALNAMLNKRCAALVVVEPTGAGKTALMMLPAAMTGARTTLVVMPLVALRGHLLQECDRVGIRCVAWESHDDPNTGLYMQANIIIVAAEHLRLPSFRRLVNTLQAAERLERAVIDEAHMPLTAGEWRPALLNCNVLTTLGVPLLLLTATLPVRDEKRLLASLRIERTRARVLRSSTVRPNIAYRVVNVGDVVPIGTSDVYGPTGIAEVVKQERDRRQPGSRKTMVFVDDIAWVQRLARLFPGAWAYYHGAPDGQRALDEFAASNDGILFSTSAAAHGLDVPDVDVVVHGTWPDGLIAYIQGSGRGGRRGQPATAILLVGKGIRDPTPRGGRAQEDRQTIKEYAQLDVALESAVCRRVLIDIHMDGDKKRTQCEPDQGEMVCDVCEAREQERDDSDTAEDDEIESNEGADAVEDLNSSFEDEEWAAARETMRWLPDARLPDTPPPTYSKAKTRAAIQPLAPSARASPLSASTASIEQWIDSRGVISPPTSHSSWPNSGRPQSHSGSGRCGHSPSGSGPKPSSPTSSAVTRGQKRSAGPRQLQLERDRDAQCMAWRAVWGNDGHAQPRPLDRIRATLQFWRFNCRAHLLDGGNFRHASADCDGLEHVHAQITAASQIWNTDAFTLDKYTGCWVCKVPSGLCAGGTKGGRCEKVWSHVVVDAWAACLLRPAAQAWCSNVLRGQGLPADVTDSAAMRYMGRLIHVHEEPERITTVVLIELLVSMTERFFQSPVVELASLRELAAR